VFLVLAGLAATVVTTSAGSSRSGVVPRLVFPLVAKTDLWDNYGDPRSNGATPVSTWRTPCTRPSSRSRTAT
jgi:hypothetical protein